MKKLLLMMTAVATLFVACCGEEKVALEGTSWNLIELNGKPVDRSAIADTSSYTLNFEAEEGGVRAYGMGDCNRFFGGAVIDIEKGSLKMENLGSTRAMCANQQLEDEYIRVLTETTGYKVKNKELFLLNGEKTVAKFKK